MRLAPLALLLGGCLMPRYLGQAAYGQLDLLSRAQSVDDAMRDPNIPLAVRELLAEIPLIKAYGRQVGLKLTKNYRTYVQLDHDYAVYFVGAAPKLSLESRKWCFPIAGCFTGLGWFDQEDAIDFKQDLERAGWDAMARPAAAYSTGGWFPDPLVSPMLPDGDPDTLDEETGFADLANVVLHESVHATIFVPDEPYFNEGIAEYLGDQLADELLVLKFGADSPEVVAYREGLAWRAKYVARELVAVEELKAVYASDDTDDKKLANKAKIIDALMVDLGMRRRPNNASLVEVRVYSASYEGFAEVHAACGSLTNLIAAGKRVSRSDFAEDLQEEFAPVLDKMKKVCAQMGGT